MQALTYDFANTIDALPDRHGRCLLAAWRLISARRYNSPMIAT